LILCFLDAPEKNGEKNREEGYKQAIQDVSEWNNRRLAAESRGETFTEPPPGENMENRKKKRFIFF